MNCYSFKPGEPEPINFETIRVEGPATSLPEASVRENNDLILYQKGAYATIKGPLGCSKVKFIKPVCAEDRLAAVEIYESSLSLLHFAHSRNAEINCKIICEEVSIESDEDVIYLDEEDYYGTMAASSEDIMTPGELLEKELDHENNIQESSFPKRRSSRKRTSKSSASASR